MLAHAMARHRALSLRSTADMKKTNARTQRVRRAPEREAALLLASEDNNALVLRFASTARKHFKHLVVHEELMAPLATICGECAQGSLPMRELLSRISALPSPTVCDEDEPLVARSEVTARWESLLQQLRTRLPHGAHEQRLRAALPLVPPEPPQDRIAALLMLMQGALKCDAVDLQHELLDHFRAIAATGERRLAALVQEPLLRRLNVPEVGALPRAAPLDATDDVPTAKAALREDMKAAAAAATLAPASLFAWEDDLAGLLAAAHLARRGDSRGSKHGCVLVEHVSTAHADAATAASADAPPPTVHDRDVGSSSRGVGVDAAGAAGAAGPSTMARVLGAGWNHYLHDRRSNNQKRVIHAEVHAITRALRRYGATHMRAAFARSTVYIVELVGGVGYDAAHPCPNCEGTLRALGLRAVVHTTGDGAIVRRELGPPLPHLLQEVENGPCGALRIAMAARAEDLLPWEQPAPKQPRPPKKHDHGSRGG